MMCEQSQWQRGVAAATLLMGMGLSGCSLNPYHSQFMCAAAANHGKCETVAEAYDEALVQKTAAAPASQRTPALKASPSGGRTEASEKAGPRGGTNPLVPVSHEVTTAEEEYRQAQYKKLAALVEEPVTPIVEPAKAMRTLILSYPAGDSLYMPRYVFWFAEAPKFVIGEYLNPQSTVQSIYPNGGP